MKLVDKILLEVSSPNVLYHVTNISNLNDIKAHGLLPMFGPTLKRFYGGMYNFNKKHTEDDEEVQVDFDGILFFSKTPLMGYSKMDDVGSTGDFDWSQALVCAVEKNDTIFRKVDNRWPTIEDAFGHEVTSVNGIANEDLPIFIETGDYFSFEGQSVKQLLYGKALENFMKKKFPLTHADPKRQKRITYSESISHKILKECQHFV